MENQINKKKINYWLVFIVAALAASLGTLPGLLLIGSKFAITTGAMIGGMLGAIYASRINSNK